MNEPGPPPQPGPYVPRSRRPDNRSSAGWPPDAAASEVSDVSDTSVLPGPAFTAVFPPDAGDAASARTAEFAADEATRVLPSAASRPPAAVPLPVAGPAGAPPSATTPLMPPEPSAGAALPPGAAPFAGAAPAPMGVPVGPGAPGAPAVPSAPAAPGARGPRRAGAPGGGRRTIALVAGAVALIVVAFGAGALTGWFGRDSDDAGTVVPPASVQPTPAPGDSAADSDSDVPPAPAQQATGDSDDGSDDDSADRAPSTDDSARQGGGQHDNGPGAQTGDSDPRRDATRPAAPDPRGGAGGDHGSGRSPNDGDDDDDDDDGD